MEAQGHAGMYHFDLLPARPKPHAVESLNSYLTRLGEANFIEHLHILIATLAWRHDYVRQPNDIPPPSWGALPQITGCSSSQLTGTTFYPLAHRFSRSGQVAGPIGRFLSGSIAPHLRWCPECLIERPWYPLTWRFLALKGCPCHGRHLLEGCAQCGRPVPLLAAPLRIGECSHCGADLRLQEASRLADSEQVLAERRLVDLEFLLRGSAQAETKSVAVGEWLAAKRRSMDKTQIQVAESIGERPERIGVVERGEIELGQSFALYLKYADFLGVTLQEIFTTSIPECRLAAPEAPQEPLVPSGEEEMVRIVLEAIQALQTRGEQVSQSAICRQTVLSRGGIRYYPRVRALLHQVEEERRQEERERAARYEQELAQKVTVAIGELKQQGKRISQAMVSKSLGVPRASLNYYPKVRAILRAATEGKDGVGTGRNGVQGVCKGVTEEEVIAQVQSAISSLRQRGRTVTQVAIAGWVNISTGRLRKYEKVRHLLDAVMSERKEYLAAQKEAREQALLARVTEAIERLKLQDKPVNQLTISELVGVSTPTLLYYPRVRAVVEPLEGERWKAIKGRRHSKEDMLEAAVREAANTLKASGQVATQEAISELVGMKEAGLRKYPRVRAILNELVPQTKEEKARQRAQEQKVFVKRVLRIIGGLEKRNERVTYRALERMAGRTTACLRSYPQIKAAVEGSPQNPRNKKHRDLAVSAA